MFKVLEICAGAGGQALGLERAGLDHVAVLDNDPDACNTLRHNRPQWKVIEADLKSFDGRPYAGTDILAGGVPCPPFSIAGKQLGSDDERDLFPEALRLVTEIKPKAVLLENVKGLHSNRFSVYKEQLFAQFGKLGYQVTSSLINASDFSVPQLRPRFIIIALRSEYSPFFQWPSAHGSVVTVAEAIGDLMLSRKWKGGKAWLKKANSIAPTIVGGSKKHGGPDLGPTRARRQWAQLGVNGLSIGNEIPGPDFPKDEMPRLTLRMVARIQGFPDSWEFLGKKTPAYRQIGNAFPPPVAQAIGVELVMALRKQAPERASSGQLDFLNPFGNV